MFLIRQMRDQADELFEAGVQLLDMAKFTLLLLPVFSVYVLPIAVLLGVVFGIARLSKDSEMVAVRASGISLRQLGPPMLVLGALLSLVCFGVVEGFAPSAVVKARQLVINSILRRPAALAKPGQLMKLGPMTMKVESGDPDRGTMENVEIVFLEEDKPTIVVIAKKGAFIKSENGVPVLRLEDGEVHVKGGTGVTWFEWAKVPLDYAGISSLESLHGGADTREPETMHLRELARAASEESLSPARRIKLRNELGERCSLPFACFVFVLIGLPLAGRNVRRIKLRNELGERCSLPFACFVFVLIGLPLAGRNVRAGRSYGLLLAFLTIIVYYVLLMAGQTLVERELANPILANWLPNIVLGSAGVVLYKRAQ